MKSAPRIIPHTLVDAVTLGTLSPPGGKARLAPAAAKSPRLHGDFPHRASAVVAAPSSRETPMTLRFLAPAAAALALMSAPALAEPGFVGNTIVSETESYGSLSFYLAEDGSFKGSDGSSGSWSYDGETLCFDDFCGAFDGSKSVGDSWEGVDWGTGAPASVSIVAGDAV
ncbi:MAG: hypothetical protein AAGL49_04020 [Pseudomonadota bacterium]